MTRRKDSTLPPSAGRGINIICSPPLNCGGDYSRRCGFSSKDVVIPLLVPDPIMTFAFLKGRKSNTKSPRIYIKELILIKQVRRQNFLEFIYR